MGETIRLTARDGHVLDAYRAHAAGEPLGGVVVVQEVFGLTSDMKRVTDRFAEAGFEAVAPAMFDRVERGLVLDYSELERGLAVKGQLQWPDTLADVQSAAEALGDGLRVAVVGFCWGGTVAHVAASDLPIAAAVSYYGGGIARMLDRQPKCPVLYHFGDQDRSIPPEDVERIRAANPSGIYHVYAGAGHGFSCEDRSAYSPDDAALAFRRSVDFLREHLAGG